MNSSTIINRPVYVVGAGGIGVVLAWCLQKTGTPVSIVETSDDKIEYGRIHGLNIAGHDSVFPEFLYFNEWQPEPDALCLLCTKTYNNTEVLQRIHDPAMLLPVQNGFDPLLDSCTHPGEGIVSFVSECQRNAPVTRLTRQGEFHIGPRSRLDNDKTEHLKALAETLKTLNLFPVHYVENITPYKYTKLMYNAAISPLAASAGVDNSELLGHPLAKNLFITLLKENYAILQHAGIQLEKIGPMHPDLVNKILKFRPLMEIMAVFFKPSLRGTYCSMAPDIHTANTEIDAYNGHLVALAKDFPCPVNRAAIDMVNNIVSRQLPTGLHHLSALAGSLPEGVLN